MILPPPPPLEPSNIALFLDLDGTLADIAERPEDVLPSSRRTRVLRAIGKRLDGRLAILTGRSLDDADRILQRSVATVAAVHGLVRRTPDGAVHAAEPSPHLAEAKAVMTAFADSRPGVFVEDKLASLALHFRQAPPAAADARSLAADLARTWGLGLQEGSMVSELRTAGPDKGDALRALLECSLFAGASPVMVGDDLTDEAAFEAAESLGGYSVLVGPTRPTRARYRLESVAEVLVWLDEGAGR